MTVTVEVETPALLIAARERVAAGEKMPRSQAVWLVTVGWTAETYATLAELAARARDHSGGGAPPVRVWTKWIAETAEAATRRGADWADLLPWLRVLCANTAWAGGGLYRRLRDDWPGLAGEWVGCPAEVATLGFAAGMSAEETRARYAVATPNGIRELRLLAGLRGYRLDDEDVAR